jgi:hypothetical protein
MLKTRFALRLLVPTPSLLCTAPAKKPRTECLLSAGGRHRGGGGGESAQPWLKTAGCPVPQSLY